MTSIEYMKKQAEKHKKSLEHTKVRKGVTEAEIDNLKSKIKHYEDAVKALESMM